MGTPEEHAEVSRKLTAREKKLLPIYHQVSIQFVDLHDRSGRMLAKGVISGEVKWSDARRFFFWRLRRRLNEEYVLKMIGTHLKNASKLEKVARLKSWMPSVNYEDDQEVSNWIEEHHSKLSKRLEELKHVATRADLMKL